MYKLSQPLLALSLLFLVSCAPFKTPPSEYDGKMIAFGNGGGFVGKETGYLLMENGEVYKMDHQQSYSPLKVLNKNVVDQIFQNIEFLNLADRPMMKPGNTYRFIDVQTDDEPVRISWDDITKNAPEDIMKFYNILNQYTLQND